WQLDVETMKSVLPGRVAMNPLTALGFVIAAGSLWLLQREFSGPRSRRRSVRVVRISAAAVVMIGLVAALGYALRENMGLDQLMFRTRLKDNRIAPNTALNFILVGAALLLLDWGPRRGARAAQVLALVPTTIALTSLLGYVYSVGGL